MIEVSMNIDEKENFISLVSGIPDKPIVNWPIKPVKSTGIRYWYVNARSEFFGKRCIVISGTNISNGGPSEFLVMFRHKTLKVISFGSLRKNYCHILKQKQKYDMAMQKKAHQAIAIAIKQRTLIKSKRCQICNNTSKTVGHHYAGYNPENHLIVWWICYRCNSALAGFHNNEFPTISKAREFIYYNHSRYTLYNKNCKEFIRKNIQKRVHDESNSFQLPLFTLSHLTNGSR
jgi:hypothetical protein